MRAKQNLSTPCLLACLLAALAAGPASAEEGGRRGFFERRGGGDDASGVQAEFGGIGTCADADKNFTRLLRGPLGGRMAGPAPDLKDIAYGSQAKQRLDVFLAKSGDKPAPVIVMVHGGGWCVGDKALPGVTRGKHEHWGRKGFVFVSVNYPMIPDGSRALQQAASVARAVAYVQQHASEWGGDAQRVILMGHSAGAHLVSLVNADARLRAAEGVKPMLGVVSLDSGATNTVTQMNKSMPKMKGRFIEAFGSEESGWIQASPYHQLDRTAAPWLGVCSTQRPDDPCEQARQYAEKSNSLGVKATVLPVDKKHGAINKDLGDAGSYTAEVDRFLGGLDGAVLARIGRGS
jgi:arylformamidase